MKVVALGGAGAMGRVAARTAAAFDCVDEIVIADRDVATAERVAADCGSKARAARIDVTDTAALAALLAPADAVLNTVGPFFRFALPILRTAIATRTHYLDINDDWEPTLEMLELHDEAVRAGVTAIVGMGASPGVSNLLAVKAARTLDTVHTLVTGWGIEDAELERRDHGHGEPELPTAAVVHWMHQCSGTIRILRDGELVDVAPVQELAIDFPEIGTGPAWTVGHPEAVTLPRTFASLRECINVMALPRWLAGVVQVFQAEIDAGRLTAEEAAAQIMSAPALPAEAAVPDAEVRLPPLFAYASGRRDGKPAAVGVTVLGMPPGGMAGATGVPLAVGFALFARGAAPRHGVFAPEACVEPDAFFDALAPYCSPAIGRGAEMIAVLGR